MSDLMQLFSFSSTAHRVLYRYRFSFTDFSPIESDTVKLDVQEAFYDVCKSIVHSIADNPNILGLPTMLSDKWLNAHEILKDCPDVYKVRSACQKAFVDLACFLFYAGQLGTCEDDFLVVNKHDLPKTTGKVFNIYKELLSRSGLMVADRGDTVAFKTPSNPNMPAAWKSLAAACAERPGHAREQALSFILWMHVPDDDGSYFLERIQHLLDLEEGFFHKAAEMYRSKGYDTAFKIDEYKVSVTYSNGISGLSIEFSTLWPTVRFVNLSCIGIKVILENAPACDDNFVRQLAHFCKPCTNCMVCTKGGKNKPFTTEIQLGHNKHHVCPEFVQMEWYNQDISIHKIEFLLTLNELQVKFGRKPQKK